MRVLFLMLYPEATASPRYRVAQFLPYLQASGLTCTAVSPMNAREWRSHATSTRRFRNWSYHLLEARRRTAQILSCGRFDVVFVQKALTTAYVRGLDALLRRRSHRLIYDIDDAVHLAPPVTLRGPWRVFEDRHQVYSLMRAAERVLAGNAWLAAEASACGARAELFPTVVDTDRFMPDHAREKAFTIGWIGSPSTTPHLNRLSGVLRKQSNARVLLVGADGRQIDWSGPGAPGQELVIAEWSLIEEVALIQQMSIGIMPLPHDTWTRGKCALKALLYMSCGIPCVATPYGAALDVIRHGVNGLLAETPDEWDAAIERLRDPAERRRLGEAARATVESRYSLRNAVPRLRELLESAA